MAIEPLSCPNPRCNPDDFHVEACEDEARNTVAAVCFECGMTGPPVARTGEGCASEADVAAAFVNWNDLPRNSPRAEVVCGASRFRGEKSLWLGLRSPGILGIVVAHLDRDRAVALARELPPLIRATWPEPCRRAEDAFRSAVHSAVCECSSHLGRCASGGMSWGEITSLLSDRIYESLSARPEAARALAELTNVTPEDE